MREAEATEVLSKALNNHFPGDVAEAIQADREMFGVIVTHAVREGIDAATLDGRIDVVKSDTNDGTLDWLAAKADSPAGWLYSQMDRWW